MPYKVFVAGEEALAADANSYLMSQTVPRFTNATQRTTQLAAPVLNQLSMLDTTPGIVQYWNGTAWVDALPRGRASEVTPANYTTLGTSGVIVTGMNATLPNVSGRRHLVTASGYIRKNDGVIGTAQMWLETLTVHDRTVLASMSGNFSVPWSLRFTYVNRPGVLVAMGAICDTTTAALGEMTMTVDDVGPQ